MKRLLWILIFLQTSLVFASEERDKNPYVSAQRFMAINRSLTSKAEAEYELLSKEEAVRPSEEITEKLSKLRYKIKALQDDAVRLQSELPKNVRASEFLKDLLNRNHVDVPREKKLDEKLGAVFALHEKALSLVSQNKYSEASKIYEEIILESPDDDEAYLLLGHTRLLTAEYEKAKTAFLNAIHIDPSNRAEIPRFYENILVENPQDDAAYSHLGFAYWIIEEKEKARQAFETAVELNPENKEAKTALDRIRAN